MDRDVSKLPQETRQHLIDPNLLRMEKTLCDVLEHISEVETEIEEMKKQPDTLKSLLTDEEYIIGGYISIIVKLEELVRIADIQGGLCGSWCRQAQWFMARKQPLIWLNEIKKLEEDALKRLMTYFNQ